nr:MAG TPA: Large Terminase [Caudoviricetes sp.]
MDFYGEQDRDEEGYYRHYHYLYLEIPKKNGKTETIAGLGLYHLVADEEPNPQVYIVAADKNNASICYDAMCGMVEQAKWLQKLVKTLPSRKEIQLRDGSGFAKVLSSDAETKHGYNPSCVIFDELHAQPNRKLWDVMTFGSQSARRQPTWLVLTTAGDDPDRNSIGWEIHEKCRRILAARDGTGNPADDDPLWLPVIYGMPDDPEEVAKIDIYDEALWYRLNPNLGVTIPIRTLRSEAASAKQSEASERLFRWLRLNQWIAVKAVGWLPLTLYDRTQWHVPRLDTMELKGPELRKRMRETLKGKKCFGGLDLSSTTDLSAFVLVFPPQSGLELWVTLFWAWRPRATVEAMEKKDHVPYRDWARAGYLNLCEGELIDFDSIKATVLDAKRLYHLQALGVDPYLSREITGYLRDRGLNVIEIRQNMAEMSPPMKEIEKLLRSGQMVHEHNTCARWCFGNVRCAVDGNENIKPMKNKSTGRIDITVAWIIAYAAAMLQPENQLADLVATGRWSL